MGVPALTRLDYDAAGGKEIFLSYEDSNETLYGLLRLRVQDSPILDMSPPVAVIRELHVYGPEIGLGDRSELSNILQSPHTAQHRGYGRALLAAAENIARNEFRAERIVVLSGVGAKQYYAETGYRKVGDYMVKPL
jgi:elongator complex protein 3